MYAEISATTGCARTGIAEISGPELRVWWNVLGQRFRAVLEVTTDDIPRSILQHDEQDECSIARSGRRQL